MRNNMWVFAALAAMALGGAETSAAAPVTPPEGVQFALTYTSAVPERYYVLSGPAQSYASFPVNQQVRQQLEAYFARARGGSGAETVSVSIHLESIFTDYKEVGAAATDRPAVRLAAWDRHRRAWADREGDGPSIPEEIRKSVVLMLEGTVVRPGQPPRKTSFHASAQEVVDRDHWDRWAYDYGPVIAEAAKKAVVEVDRVVREALK